MAIEVTDEQIQAALTRLDNYVWAAKEEHAKRIIAETAGEFDLAEKHKRRTLMYGDMATGAREVLKALSLLDKEA